MGYIAVLVKVSLSRLKEEQFYTRVDFQSKYGRNQCKVLQVLLMVSLKTRFEMHKTVGHWDNDASSNFTNSMTD